MAFVAAAIGGAGLLSAGASIWGANKNAETQSAAANAAAATNNSALQLQRDNFDYQRKNFEGTKGNLNPFIQSGMGANNLLASAYGLNGTNPALGQSALEQFQKSPDYQFALKGGSDALDNSAAAKGGVLSGNQIRAQTEYGSGLATQNLQNYFSRLTGLSQQGMTAGGYLGQIGANIGNTAAGQIGTTANNVGNNYMAAGTAQAAGINGMIGGFNGGLSQLSLYNQLNKSSYSNGGSSYPTGGTAFSLSGTGGLY